MQEMDCRSFKDLLDSYLSQELTIETNHAILRHAEQCRGCRIELAARRRVRETLRRACLQEQLSNEERARLRASLRAALESETSQKTTTGGWNEVLSRFFRFHPALPIAATVLLLLSAGAVILYLSDRSEHSPQIAELSVALFDESAGDHQKCATNFIHASGATSMPESVKKTDPAYVALERFAEPGAQGLQLRAAHVCGFEGRRFAHLVYKRESQLLSLLVTERNGPALKIGKVPVDDGSRHGLQRATRNGHALGAYQTARHIVLVVSDLPERENDILAKRLAGPVIEHLRRVEGTSTACLDCGLRIPDRGLTDRGVETQNLASLQPAISEPLVLKREKR
jgi:hypothetical protein